ncbi:MAG: hypothetical protein QM751_13020 [Paludibacteraceae bacterium]
MKIKINLTKIKGACRLALQGKNGIKECLVIPLDSIGLVHQNNSVYINLYAFELKDKKGQSHFIKQVFTVEQLDSLTDAERNIVIGGIKADQFSGSLPSSGIMRNGRLYQSERLVTRMREKGLFSLPTVVKSDAMRVTEFSKEHLLKSALKHKNKTSLFYINLAEEILLWTGYNLSPEFCRILQGFPKKWLKQK